MLAARMNRYKLGHNKTRSLAHQQPKTLRREVTGMRLMALRGRKQKKKMQKKNSEKVQKTEKNGAHHPDSAIAPVKAK